MLTRKSAIIFGMAAIVLAFLFPPIYRPHGNFGSGQFDGWWFIGDLASGKSVDLSILLVEFLVIAILTAGLYFLSRMD